MASSKFYVIGRNTAIAYGPFGTRKAAKDAVRRMLGSEKKYYGTLRVRDAAAFEATVPTVRPF